MASKKKKPTKSIVVDLKSKPKWKLGFLAMAALLLVTSVGYAAYGKWQLNKRSAEASGWSELRVYASDGVSQLGGVQSLRACRTEVSSPYGTLFKIKVQAVRTKTSIYSVGVNVYATDSNVITAKVSQTNWLYGVVAGTEIYASKVLRQKVGIFVTGTNTDLHYPGYWFGTIFIDPYNLFNC